MVRSHYFFHSNLFTFSYLMCLSLVLSSCSYYRAKNVEDLSSLTKDGGGVSYQVVHDRVFAPYCISCHGNGGGVNLESYASVKQSLSAIENSVFVTKTMPKGRALGVSELSILSSWIKSGAPETLAGLKTSLPSPNVDAEEKLKPTFVSIKKKVFDVKCMSCHSSGGSAPRVPLSSEKEIIDSPGELLIPGNSAESGLYISIIREDSKRMPPAESGASALTANEISVIKEWIDTYVPPSL